ncbi:MAG: LysE family transporter [Duncaniella sp.]|nr:LysE family transporter [Duncaniella sp.]
MNLLLEILFSGLIIGILVSAPMGPIGMLIIRRTLIRGRWPAFFTGIGAALSDLTYCLLVGLGLSFVTDFVETNQYLLQMLGSIVMLIYAGYLFGSNPARSIKPGAMRPMAPWRDCVSGFLLTFSNPLILFLIIGLFTRFTFQAPRFAWWHQVGGYIAIAAGALGWWFAVTWFVNRVRRHFNMRSLWLINKIIASLILIMGGYGLFNAVRELLF